MKSNFNIFRFSTDQGPSEKSSSALHSFEICPCVMGVTSE